MINSIITEHDKPNPGTQFENLFLILWYISVTLRYVTLRYGMAWHGMAWHGMVWYGMRCDVMSCHVMSCYVMKKPTTFGKVLTDSFHMSRALGSSYIEKVATELESNPQPQVKGDRTDHCATEAPV